MEKCCPTDGQGAVTFHCFLPSFVPHRAHFSKVAFAPYFVLGLGRVGGAVTDRERTPRCARAPSIHPFIRPSVRPPVLVGEGGIENKYSAGRPIIRKVLKIRIWVVPRSAWAVGSYSSGPPAGETPQILIFKT